MPSCWNQLRNFYNNRHVIGVSVCGFAVLDVYTDINTIFNLFSFGSNDGLCTYQCSMFLAWILVAIVVTASSLQAKVILEDEFYGSLPKRMCYSCLALIGFGTLPVLIEIWNTIDNDEHFNRFFRMRWIETTKESLPGSAVQIVALLFFSNLAFLFSNDSDEISNTSDDSTSDSSSINTSVFGTFGISPTITIIFSILTSLISVGNNTRKYLTFKSVRSVTIDIRKSTRKLVRNGNYNYNQDIAANANIHNNNNENNKPTKPIWYYYSVAMHIATDMLHRSLVLLMFFVFILNVEYYDIYIPLVCFVIILHSILFEFIEKQRNKHGQDISKESIGLCIQSHPVFTTIFVILWLFMPSNVLFLRNFHVLDAKLAFKCVIINGIIVLFIGMISITMWFELLYSNNYIDFYAIYYIIVYFLLFGIIPFVLVIIGRDKDKRSQSLSNKNKVSSPNSRRGSIDHTPNNNNNNNNHNNNNKQGKLQPWQHPHSGGFGPQPAPQDDSAAGQNYLGRPQLDYRRVSVSNSGSDNRDREHIHDDAKVLSAIVNIGGVIGANINKKLGASSLSRDRNTKNRGGGVDHSYSGGGSHGSNCNSNNPSDHEENGTSKSKKNSKTKKTKNNGKTKIKTKTKTKPKATKGNGNKKKSSGDASSRIKIYKNSSVDSVSKKTGSGKGGQRSKSNTGRRKVKARKTTDSRSRSQEPKRRSRRKGGKDRSKHGQKFKTIGHQKLPSVSNDRGSHKNRLQSTSNSLVVSVHTNGKHSY